MGRCVIEQDLKGKKALVCGASQGIGEATARLLAQRGAQVILLARSEDKLRSLQAELPGDCRYLALDLADRALLESKVKGLLNELRSIEILICNTGGPKGGALIDADETSFISAFENHVLVNSLLARLLVPGMKQQTYGRIINIISTSVKIPIPNLGVSNTIRGAVANWAKTLSVELGPMGITVNNVLPGYTETPRLEALLQAAAEKSQGSVAAVTEEWKNKVPLRRFARPEETAEAVAFLASPRASYISGINLPVDGGRTGSL